MPRKINDFKIKQELSNGANLEILIFDEPGEKLPEHRWVFEYRYMHPADRGPGEVPQLINHTSIIVNYSDGISKDLVLRMNMVFPKRTGKTYIYGLDISENSILNSEFAYEKQGELYCMKTASFTPCPKIELSKLEPALMKPVNFPFPLKEAIPKEWGTYKVPFLRTGDEESSFDFPENYQRTREKETKKNRK